MKSAGNFDFKNKLDAIKIYVLIFISAIFVTNIHAEMLSIKGDKVHLRTGPGKNYTIKWEYGSGFPVEIIESKGKWLKIKDFENDTGWIHNSLLSKKPQTIVKANKNNKDKINIREGPGSEHKIVGKAYYGVVFEILHHESGWVEVQHESGLTGWISSNLLWGI